ncbi:MAG: hypothetical protein ACRD6W_13510, partial [Nitrososphaerales archaeon]
MLLGLTVTLGLLLGISTAVAAPIWHVTDEALPTAFQASDGPDNDAYQIQLENLGSTASNGTITLIDHLPPGITTSASPEVLPSGTVPFFACSTGAGQSVVTCTKEGSLPATSSFNEAGQESQTNISLVLPVAVAAGLTGIAKNTVTVEGGGSTPLTSSTTTPVNAGAPSSFGVSSLSFAEIDSAGEPFAQAGGHPWALTTDLSFNHELVPGASDAALKVPQGYRNVSATEEAKTIIAELPLGLIGDPQAAPRCSQRQFSEAVGDNKSACPADTRVGVIFPDRTFNTSGAYQVHN